MLLWNGHFQNVGSFSVVAILFKMPYEESQLVCLSVGLCNKRIVALRSRLCFSTISSGCTLETMLNLSGRTFIMMIF